MTREVVGHDRQQAFVTHFQGTFNLKKGNLQLRGLGSLGLSASQWKAIHQSGAIGLALANIFPESHKLSGIGEGGSCTGLGQRIYQCLEIQPLLILSCSGNSGLIEFNRHCLFLLLLPEDLAVILNFLELNQS